MPKARNILLTMFLASNCTPPHSVPTIAKTSRPTAYQKRTIEGIIKELKNSPTFPITVVLTNNPVYSGNKEVLGIAKLNEKEVWINGRKAKRVLAQVTKHELLHMYGYPHCKSKEKCVMDAKINRRTPTALCKQCKKLPLTFRR